MKQASGRSCFVFTQSLAMLQQPPSDPAGVLLPAAAPPADHWCRVGPHRCEGRSGRFLPHRPPSVGFKKNKPLSSCGKSHLISSAFHWHSSRFLVQPKMSHSQRSWSYNRGPFLCPGEAAVRQLQAVHRALPVSDEEYASGFPLHQRRCHYTLRAHAEVKSHCHRIASHTHLISRRFNGQSVCGGSWHRFFIITHCSFQYNLLTAAYFKIGKVKIIGFG